MTRWTRVCPEWLQPFEPEETGDDGHPIGTGPEAGKGEDSIGTGQEATAEPSASDAKRAMAIRMVTTGRQAEGLPPLKKLRVHLSREMGESSSVNDSIESSIPGDDDLYTECYWSSEALFEVHQSECVETSQTGYKQLQEDLSHCIRSEVEKWRGSCACVFARFQT